MLSLGLALRAAEETPSTNNPTQTDTKTTQSTPLITSPAQLYINAPLTNQINKDFTDDESIKKGFMKDLCDDDPTTYIATDTTWSEDKHYITVDLSTDEWKLNMQSSESLVVVLTRTERLYDNRPTYNNPTGMDIYYSVGYDDKGEPVWEDDILARVYFIYRGSKTVELSEPLSFTNLNARLESIHGKDGNAVPTINDIKGLKFVVSMNNGRNRVGNTVIRPMLLSGFQIYKCTPENPLIPPTPGVPRKTVVDHWVDRFHLDRDINFRYYNYEFENTPGVLDPRNRFTKDNEVHSNDETNTLDMLGGWNNFVTDKNDPNYGKWTADEAFLKEHEISMPDYSWVTNENFQTMNDQVKVNPGTKLQPTAVIEHTLYAVQGEPISLYPFYTMFKKSNEYRVNFMHWYNYKTGGHVIDKDENENEMNLLGFVGNPSDVFLSENYGWYTSPQLTTDKKYINVDDEDFVKIYTKDDYIDFVNRVNAGNSILCAKLMNDLTFNNVEGEVSPIGTNENPWSGIFLGNNHTISNLHIKENTEHDNYYEIGVGVFGVIDDGALIANLKIDDSCTIQGQKNIGFVGLVRRGNVKIYGIVNNATLSSVNKEDSNIGGIIGIVHGEPEIEGTLEVSSCVFGGKITGNANNDNAGNGLVIGYFRPSATTSSKLILKDVVVTSPSTGFSNACIYRNDGVGLCDVTVEDCYYKVHESVLDGLIDKSINIQGFKEFARIGSVEEYKNFVNWVNRGQSTLCAVLDADLNFSEVTDVRQIGTSDKPWRGSFFGRHHTINKLVINKPAEDNVGIFGVVGDGAKIENLKIENCKITGNVCVGFIGLVQPGQVSLSGIDNNSDFVGTSNVGGLIGATDYNNGLEVDVDIKDCLFSGTISATNQQGGLLIGWIRHEYNVNLSFKNVLVTSVSTDVNQDRPIFRYDGEKRPWDTPNCYYLSSSQGFDAIPEGKKQDFIEDWKEKIRVSANSEVSDLLKADFTPGSYSHDGNMVVAINPTHAGGEVGTYATFFHPRLPFEFNDYDKLRPLVEGWDSDDDVFTIAVDMAQNFNAEHNIEGNKIVEPIIKYRHIFHIKDGVHFADQNMASKAGNDAFIEKNRRHISATAKKDFQIRLDHPYPVEQTTRGVFYYKIDDTDYRRICSRIIEVRDADDNVIQRTTVDETFRQGKDGNYDPNGEFVIDPTYGAGQDANAYVPNKYGPAFKDADGNTIEGTNKILFYPTGIFDGMGSREVDGTNYYVCGGGGHFFRMLACDGENAQAGQYTVRVIGTDYNGEPITLFEDNDAELKVQEFDITFYSDETSLMATEADLNDNYVDLTNEKLEEKYGEPMDCINFDEYAQIEKQEGIDASLYLRTRTVDILKGDYPTEYDEEDYNDPIGEDVTQTAHYFRWPQPWTQTNYGFGYNDRGDYAMQLIADNTVMLSHHSKGIGGENSSDANFGKGRGLFDRHFYETNGEEKGYFYYVNAADDPGIIARLEVSNLCPGGKIHISCWIAEFSTGETANLSFNFVAIMNSGQRIPLHAHVTGYVPGKYRSQWMYVYSSFVPIMYDKKDFDISEVKYYQIELDNNAKSSMGADYAIDDIRVYVEPPSMEAKQKNPLCMTSGVEVMLSSEFDSLMQSVGKEESSSEGKSEDVHLYYAFLDKEKYDKAYKEYVDAADNPSSEGETSASEVSFDANYVFNQSVLRYDYDGNGTTFYGHLKFKTYYDGHLDYEKSDNSNGASGSDNSSAPKQPSYAFKMTDGRKRKIVFNTHPTDATMQPGKEYIAIILTKLDGEKFGSGDNVRENPEESDFDLSYRCANKSIFTVESSTVVRVDGAAIGQPYEVDACRNQLPVVQVDLYEKDDAAEGGMTLVEKNAIFDWFEGSIDDLMETIDGQNFSLWEALGNFRDEYPDALDLSDKPRGEYTESMRKVLVDHCVVTDVTLDDDDATGDNGDATGGVKVSPRILLYQSSYVFPHLAASSDEERDVYVTAVPIPKLHEGKMICTQPTEVHVLVRNRAPLLKHGIYTIKYPEAITDVPLRISLNRINEASKTNTNKPLVLPFREIKPVSSYVTQLDKGKYEPKKSETDDSAPENSVTGDSATEESGLSEVANSEIYPIFLAYTNDPDYRNLYPVEIDSEGNEVPKKGFSVEEDDLWIVGEVKSLAAVREKELDGEVRLAFFGDRITFKEGYEYQMRFLFTEVAPTESGSTTEDSESNDEEDPTAGEDPTEEGEETATVCTGHEVFTIKIVPEYQKWTGAANMNWNNDDNWRRVSFEELHYDSESITDDFKNGDDYKKHTGYVDYVSDGSNQRTFSYAPLDFTKVVIPHAIAPVDDNVTTEATEGIEADPTNVPEMFQVAEDTKEVYSGVSHPWSKLPSANTKAGEATTLVQYDMIEMRPDSESEDNGTYCRPWVANYCEQIHFESGAEIGHQQHLNYQKAWVDFETDPYRWYTLASPLQGVVAGDMYLPTDGARQLTPYFADITYEESKNHRFKPAVYQRSWNKAEAVVYKYNPENLNDTTHVQIAANWSNVYNDVTVPYSGGEGFSIKTDVSGANNFNSTDNKVLFRLPKADESYTYYSSDYESENQTGNSGNATSISRSNSDKLNEVGEPFKVTLTAATPENTLFLVGNPFMAHMDIAKFLDENSSVINPKYWILDGENQGAAIMGEYITPSDEMISTLKNPKYIAPMQGFFVEKINEVGKDYDGTTLTLTFTPDMAVTVNDVESLSEVLTRSGEAEDESRPAGLLITAKGSGSSALIAFNGSADSAYRDSEDAMFVSDATLDAPALVYTVAEGTATTVNVLPEIVSTEVGVITKEETVLLFEGVDSSMGLMLYDTEDESYTELYDGMEVKVDGSASRRLFIVSGVEQEFVSELELEIILMGNAVRVVSTEGGLSARVFDIEGKLIDSNTDADCEAMFELPKGIYVVEATDKVSRKTKKVMIR